jgi:hypothetical protein
MTIEKLFKLLKNEVKEDDETRNIRVFLDVFFLYENDKFENVSAPASLSRLQQCNYFL